LHDLAVRIASTLLLSGVLLFVAFFIFGVLYPKKAAAAAPVETKQTVDYGYLKPVAQPLEWTLRAIEEQVTRQTGRSSWGWAIIATTFLVNLLLLPFRIMAAKNAQIMRRLKPQLDEITARYKGTPASSAQSEEIAAVYRQHKTHPLSGCVVGLAPLAVLLAWYRVLNAVTQLHGAQWLWISNLSLPEQLPVRVLPLLMIATQLLMGEIAPAPGTDPRMNRFMMIGVVLFGAVLYRQPAALMLYWVTSNLLMLGQQWWLNRKYA
jgi:YidC/Oxa1 family membrane protein insertase